MSFSRQKRRLKVMHWRFKRLLRHQVDDPWERAFYVSIVVAVLFVWAVRMAGTLDMLILAGGLSSLAIGIVGMRAPKDTWIREIAPELVGISIGVIAIDQLYQMRSAQQEKQAIIRQLRSPSNEFALEAVRLSTERGWLRDGSLEGADLWGANLEDARLLEANLEGADLRHANLKGTNLTRANLKGASLEDANLEYASLLLVNLEGANLTRANLESVYLVNANLEGTNLWHANLKGTNLHDVNLEGANLVDATLEGAFLPLVNLEGANLTQANLEGAFLGATNLKDVALIDANFRGARYDNATAWPEGFDYRAAGAINVDDEE